MPGIGNADDQDHYAQVAAVTIFASGAWLSQKDMGKGISEQVRDMVIALITERDHHAKIQMISERTELSGGEAERFLVHAIFFFNLTPGMDSAYVQLFKMHLEMIREVQGRRNAR
jgi:hypothetical protein